MLLYTYISRFSENPHHQQQLYLRPSFIPIFNFSHKRLTFASADKSGYTLGFLRKIAHSGPHGETGGFTFVQSCRAFDRPSSGKRTAGGSGCTPMACVRFLRRCGPAGLRCLVCNLAVLLFFALRSVLSACARQGGYHHSRRALHVVETPDARLSKRLTRRFLALPDSSLIPAAQNIVPFLYRCQKDQRDTRWSFHFCSHLLTCPDRPDRGT